MNHRFLLIVGLVAAVLFTFTTPARVQVIDAEGVTYHLLLPKDYDAKKTYRLIVMVHGRTGQGNQANGEAAEPADHAAPEEDRECVAARSAGHAHQEAARADRVVGASRT